VGANASPRHRQSDTAFIANKSTPPTGLLISLHADVQLECCKDAAERSRHRGWRAPSPIPGRGPRLVYPPNTDQTARARRQSLGEYLDVVRRGGPYANLAVLVGHSAVRTAVMGNDASARKEPSAGELAR
jgi:hypothetical protein